MPEFRNEKLLSAVRKADSFLLCTHIAPDGDAIGSSLALAFMLEDMGKKVTIACADPVPSRLHFLPCWEMFERPEKLEGQSFSCAIAVDCADEGRLGGCERYYNKVPVRLQIDHHGTNPLYAQENEVDASASAAGCIVWRMMKALQVPVQKEHAEALYTAISSDTGNFCFENTNAECFECMQELINAGLRINEVARPLHLLREIPAVHLLSKALDSLTFEAEGRIAYMRLYRRDYLACNAGNEHNSKIVNYAMDIPGVEMSFVADETKDGIKFSIRAQPPHDVSVVASAFGGGGHKLAAGCMMKNAMMDEACDRMLEKMLEQL